MKTVRLLIATTLALAVLGGLVVALEWTQPTTARAEDAVGALAAPQILPPPYPGYGADVSDGPAAPVVVQNPEVYVDPPTIQAGAHYVFLFQITSRLVWEDYVYIQWPQAYYDPNGDGDLSDSLVPNLTYLAGDPRLAQMLMSWDPDYAKLIDPSDLANVPVTPTVASAPPERSWSWQSTWVPTGQVRLKLPDVGVGACSGNWMRVDFWGPQSVNPGRQDAGISNPDSAGTYCWYVYTSIRLDQHLNNRIIRH